MNSSTQPSEVIELLRQFDTATITNAMDYLQLGVQEATYTYSSLELRCLLPELPAMVGYAITCVSDIILPRHPKRVNQSKALYESIRDARKPVVVVCQYVGPDRLHSNQFGDIMATTFQRLGAVGAVTDGGIRDLAGIRGRVPGFQMFAPGAVPAAGASGIVEVGLPVHVCGMRIEPDDLLHGDANGIVTIPHAIATAVAARSQEITHEEQMKLDFILSPEFTVDELARRSGW